MKKIFVLFLLLVVTGCSSSTQEDSKRKIFPELKKNKIIYIPLPFDFGDHVDDCHKKIPGSGKMMALALKNALIPYSNKIVIGSIYDESQESAIKNANVFGVKYIFRLNCRGQYDSPLFKLGNYRIELKLSITEVNTTAEKDTLTVSMIVGFASDHLLVPVDEVMEGIPRNLYGLVGEIFHN